MIGLIAEVLVLCAVGLFLGGIVSAALEARSERRAGLPVSRPFWEQRAARRAAGGPLAALRGYLRGLRSAPVVVLDPLDEQTPPAWLDEVEPDPEPEPFPCSCLHEDAS